MNLGNREPMEIETRGLFALTEKQRKLAIDAVAEASFRTDEEWQDIHFALSSPLGSLVQKPAVVILDELEEVRGGIYRTEEDDICGNEILFYPERQIDGFEIRQSTIIYDGIISPDIPNHLTKDGYVRLSKQLVIVRREDLDAHNDMIRRLKERGNAD